MNRLSDSTRFSITRSPCCMSWVRSAGKTERAVREVRVPAMDLIGASELFSSCPSTRMSRCQAWRSSSRNARLRSETISNWCGTPFSRNEVWLMAQRPCLPGKAICTVCGPGDWRNSCNPISSAVSPSMRGAIRPISCSPARFTIRKRCCWSKLKTATSISIITFFSSAVASRALIFCCCSLLARALISRIRSASESSRLPPRRRKEKSSSRMAATILESVCSGRITWLWSMELPIIHASAMASVNVHLVSRAWSPSQSKSPATTTPGRLMRKVVSTMRVSKFSLVRLCGGLAENDPGAGWCCGSETILLHAPVQRTAAQAECLRRTADVSRVTCQRLLNDETFYFFQAHVFYFGGTGLITPQAQIGWMDLVAGAHQYCAFDGMVQFAHVSGPGMLHRFLQGRRLKALQRLAVAQRIQLEEVTGHQGGGFPSLPHRRK